MKYVEAYKNWVRRNKGYVHSLESFANGLTWLLPERFSASVIGPEAVTSILGILTAINEYIIDTTPTKWLPPAPPPLPYSLFISALKEVETLVEVVAQQLHGDDNKWNFIIITEASKAFLRLALFRNNGYKMLLHGGETPNVNYSSNPHNGLGELLKPSACQRPGYHPSNCEGKALAALNRFGENVRMAYEPSWPSRFQKQGVVTESARETLYILRPLIYVLFMRKYGRRSWIPWLVSLTVDLVGAGATSRATKLHKGNTTLKEIHLSVAEKNELKRRRLLWALYIMRDPFFCKYTRRRLESTQKALGHVPVIGSLKGKR